MANSGKILQLIFRRLNRDCNFFKSKYSYVMQAFKAYQLQSTKYKIKGNRSKMIHIFHLYKQKEAFVYKCIWIKSRT